MKKFPLNKKVWTLKSWEKLKKTCQVKNYYKLGESNRILDEFRGDLKVSIGSIEEQLREKVDRFNLDEFGKRMDTKFNTEISKKIDKFDLKKNNVLLNKKVITK